MKLALNILFFKLTWLACVLGGANGLAWIGPLFCIAFLLAQRHWLGAPKNEWQLVAAIAGIGFLVDSSYVLSGLVQFATPGPLTNAAPIWIVAMWANFALTLNHSMRWFQDHLIIAALMGAVAGPGAYLAGRALGAAQFLAADAAVLTVLALAWGSAVPLTLMLASRFNEQSNPPFTSQPPRASQA
jgi:hypothetical protein